MNNILIIIDGILAKHFLERLCLEKGLGYFFTIICHNAQKNNLNIFGEDIDLYYFDPTSVARLENIMTKDFKQAFIYMQDEFETKKSYEALRSLDPNLEIEIMDFWGLSINDAHTNLADARMTLSRRFMDFLPDIALTAQYIGLGLGEIMEVKIPAGSIFAYRHISSIQQKRWRIVLIYRNSKIYFVKPSFVLEPNDSILIVGDPVVLQSIFHNIREKSGQFPIPFGNNIFALIDMKNMSETIQEKILNTTLKLTQKINAKKFFIHVINPSLDPMYKKLKEFSYEKQGVFFDFFHTDFKQIYTQLQNQDIGLIITDINNFEKEKKVFFDLKIPIMKIGEKEFDQIKEAIILSANESELENNANVITDLSKQLGFEVILYYYNPNLQNTKDMEEYFRSLSKLYDKNIQIINKSDENPLLNLQYRQNLLQFISFEKELLNRNFGRSLSMNLNRHYYKMRQNYQLFIPVE
ncbi:COG3400 family protein [Campylobacter hepaticus]|uniref:Potassium transporter TrkA n=1 Tax=Campylobacter hepaticus TaxID=1813019 RepID=A0A424Z060_9BACT|nr:COG3400 family protein [Campylobacter hepaticus]AXP08491.1 potassium transporter TrkA [Campylobacter hepaticus]MCZ0772327.1 COG3400 family protein [Campylobacter hepaticus]MCZ0773795.1 COG3400 family protein [Campylobacter hepaticus]MCZ0775046.1 COG3400 family protein [Campylobacter hepaticus]MDX2322915.1 COG3400 family protein [Campylobacter hepaticus]